MLGAAPDMIALAAMGPPPKPGKILYQPGALSASSSSISCLLCLIVFSLSQT